tara:strand:- start:110 stop:481 length:372 start_codon:yes stop_codon:yes gene_type:complete
LKAISTKNNTLSEKIYITVEKELKLFYFNAFSRRPKNLLTLELIKECYSDQIKFFLNKISQIIKSYKKSNNKKELFGKLIEFKKNEGCNKKIMESIILHLSDSHENLAFTSSESKTLFLFEEK